MQRFSLGLTGVLLAGSAIAADSGIIQSPAYKECIALASSNPAQALVKADGWLTVDNGIAAHHCRAMALYGLRRYAEAGDALNTLRAEIPQENISLRSFVTKQAVSAWIGANRADTALTILDAQLSEMTQSYGNNALSAKLTAELLLERAKINITYGKVKLATQDLDHAISLTPVNGELLLERAKAFELLGDIPLALADTEAALTLDPNNAAARAELTRLDAKSAPTAAPR